MSYEPQRCECGHTSGQHRTIANAAGVTHGLCHACECKKFRLVEPKS